MEAEEAYTKQRLEEVLKKNKEAKKRKSETDNVFQRSHKEAFGVACEIITCISCGSCRSENDPLQVERVAFLLVLFSLFFVVLYFFIFVYFVIFPPNTLYISSKYWQGYQRKQCR